MGSDPTMTTPGRAVDGAGAHRILVVYGPASSEHAGVTVALGADPVAVGRAPDEAGPLGLDDGQASRAHAVFEPSDQGWRVRDLGSHNGTFVDGVRVESQDLADGNVIRIGSHLLLFQFISIEAAQRLERGRRNDSALVGESVAMHLLRDDIRRAAVERGPVLVLGETGTGKELVAAEIHRLSEREGRLVAVNCAALPENLVESELFGHAKGAFTGATGASEGLFGAADGGTLFLDEVGEMPLPMQAKLLRVLATGEVRRVGETDSRTVDVRLAAATNVNLRAAVDDSSFRADLYARLKGISLVAPPLRDRREDILGLASHFLTADDPRAVDITPDAAEALIVHGWEFNVRELEQAIESCRTAARSAGELDLPNLPGELQGPILDRQQSRATGEELPLPLRVRQKGTPNARELREAFEHFRGNVAHVAEFFGKERRQIYRWCQRLGVDPEAFRSE